MTTFDLVKRKSQLLSGKLRALATERRIRRTLRNPAPAVTDAVDFVIFFADGPGQSYQLEQWVAPFEALRARGYGVCVIVMNALTARILDDVGSLPILLTRSMEYIQNTMESWGTSGVFYVNNSQSNFTMLRAIGPAHIHLSHGESEKSSMVSNQLKAYDFVFIAGEAARDRILAHIPRLDDTKLVEIGRPQLTVGNPSSRSESTSTLIKVLYAPTWEGDSKGMDYSSVTSIGARLVSALLQDERFVVVFRPHPKTGAWSQNAKQELKHIEKTVADAQHRLPAARHRIETSGDSSLSILESDIVLCDISAMAMDAIGLDKPLLLLHSVDSTLTSELAPEQTLSLFQAGTMLGDNHARQLLDRIASMAASGPSREQRSLRDKVFGSPSLGNPTERFIAATIAVTDAADRS